MVLKRRLNSCLFHFFVIGKGRLNTLRPNYLPHSSHILGVPSYIIYGMVGIFEHFDMFGDSQATSSSLFHPFFSLGGLSPSMAS